MNVSIVQKNLHKNQSDLYEFTFKYELNMNVNIVQQNFLCKRREFKFLKNEIENVVSYLQLEKNQCQHR